MMRSTNDEVMIEMALNTIIVEKMKNGGRAPDKMIPRIVNQLAMQGIHVTRDVLNGRLRRKAKEGGQRHNSSALEATEVTNVGDQASGGVADINRTSTGQDGIPASGVRKKPRGRPKGSTKKAKRTQSSMKTRLMNDVAAEYASQRRKTKESQRVS